MRFFDVLAFLKDVSVLSVMKQLKREWKTYGSYSENRPFVL